MRCRIVGQALIAIAISGTCTATALLVVAFVLFRDVGVSAGTALTYLVPGTAQSALCLLLYHLLNGRAKRDHAADPANG